MVQIVEEKSKQCLIKLIKHKTTLCYSVISINLNFLMQVHLCICDIITNFSRVTASVYKRDRFGQVMHLNVPLNVTTTVSYAGAWKKKAIQLFLKWNIQKR